MLQISDTPRSRISLLLLSLLLLVLGLLCSCAAVRPPPPCKSQAQMEVPDPQAMAPEDPVSEWRQKVQQLTSPPQPSPSSNGSKPSSTTSKGT